MRNANHHKQDYRFSNEAYDRSFDRIQRIKMCKIRAEERAQEWQRDFWDESKEIELCEIEDLTNYRLKLRDRDELH